jgi:hypothetical protein
MVGKPGKLVTKDYPRKMPIYTYFEKPWLLMLAILAGSMLEPKGDTSSTAGMKGLRGRFWQSGYLLFIR